MRGEGCGGMGHPADGEEVRRTLGAAGLILGRIAALSVFYLGWTGTGVGMATVSGALSGIWKVTAAGR